MPGAADRHVALTMAPGTAEAVADQHAQLAPVSSRRRSRIARAEASGSRGSTISVSASRRVGGVDARVGAHEAVMGAADQHAVRLAQDLLGLIEHDLHGARVLVPAPRRARCARAHGTTSAQVAPPRPRPWRRPCGRSPRSGRRAAGAWPLGVDGAPTISSPRSAPAAISGSPLRPRAERRSQAELLSRRTGSVAASLPSSWLGARAACAYGRRVLAGQSLAQRRPDPRRCRCRAAARRVARSASFTPRSVPVVRGARSCRARSSGRSRRAGLSNSPLVPVP